MKGIKGNIAKFGKTNKLAGLLGKAGQLCDKSKLANFGVNIGGDMLFSAISDFKETGSINPMNMLSSILTGTLKGFGMNSLQFGKGAFQSDFLRKLANTAIGTGLGMGVDYGASKLRGDDYNPGKSFLQNLLQAGLGQLFGEPIDAVSGAFIMTVHEFILPDVQSIEPADFSRQWLSCYSIGL